MQQSELIQMMIYLKTLNMHNAVIRIASVFNDNHNQYYYYYHYNMKILLLYII